MSNPWDSGLATTVATIVLGDEGRTVFFAPTTAG